MNNPASYLSLNLSFVRRHLLAGTQPPEGLTTHIDNGLHATEQIIQIVRDLTGVTREQSKTVIDLSALVASALRIADHELRGHVRVEIDLQPGVFTIARSARIAQVVLNLVLNASQAAAATAPETRVVRVATYRGEDHVYIRVEDDGAGVPEAIRDRIFEPFFTTRGVVGRHRHRLVALARKRRRRRRNTDARERPRLRRELPRDFARVPEERRPRVGQRRDKAATTVPPATPSSTASDASPTTLEIIGRQRVSSNHLCAGQESNLHALRR